MKLAVALDERSNAKKKIIELKNRLVNNACVQEGSEPAEDPKDLFRELEQNLTRYDTLVSAINLTNSRTITDSGRTLTELLSQRDTLEMKVEITRVILDRASNPQQNRYSNTEIRQLPTISVRNIQIHLNKQEKQLRELNLKIQEYNWATEIEGLE